MISNWTKNRMAQILIGESVDIPTYFILGSGSGTAYATQTDLYNPWDRQSVTSTNGSVPLKITWIGDWNAIEMSGNQLREWGMIASGIGTAGSVWSRNTMANALTFDGTSELRIQETWEIF
jgi:hypothetical protein